MKVNAPPPTYWSFVVPVPFLINVTKMKVNGRAKVFVETILMKTCQNHVELGKYLISLGI